MNPEIPPGLSPAAEDLWRQLRNDLGICDPKALLLLNVAVESWGEMRAAREQLTAEGMVIENPSTGHRRAHPAAAILRHARQAHLRAVELLFATLGKVNPGELDDEFTRF